MHQEYLKAFADKATSDVRILGTWLEGSFAKGTADRYSDIDIHLLVAEANKETFQQELAILVIRYSVAGSLQRHVSWTDDDLHYNSRLAS